MIRVILFCLLATSALAGEKTLLVIGDSISAGYGLPANQVWVERLNSRLASQNQDYTVVNASISGDTTSGGLSRLPAALQRHQPDIVIIELGGNDGLRGLSLKQMRLNLEGMTEKAKEHGAQVLLLGMQIPSNYGPAYTTRFNHVFRKVSESTGASLMPFFLEPIAGDINHFQTDGIHPSAEAQQLLLDGMWPYLEPLL